MNKRMKNILTTSGYVLEVDKTDIYLYIEELEQKVNQLETSITSKDSELVQLKDELLQLKTNIDEAIEYMNKKYEEYFIEDKYPFLENEFNDLTSILERGKE